MKKYFVKFLLVATLATASSFAAQISGNFNFTDGKIIASAVNVNGVEFVANPVFALLSNPTGTFAAYANSGDPITLNPDVAPFTLTSANFAMKTFSFSGFTFTPTSFGGPNFVNTLGPFFTIELKGTYSRASFEDTPGNFLITFSQPTNTQVELSAAGSGSSSPIPEPSTYALIGGALLGLGYLRRKK